MPNQKKRLSFAWRLKNGVRNATDNELDVAVSACEKNAIYCGGLVVFGLLVEVFLAVKHPPYDSFFGQWGAVVADSLVAVGVLGEVLFSARGSRCQSELQHRSNVKLSDAIREAGLARAEAATANESAAAANLKAENLRKQNLDLEKAVSP